ncbi:MAG: MurR/RpiR family transcriptional regulator [Limnohabitans sp.]
MNAVASSLLKRMKSKANALPRAQQQVIALILKDPEQALTMSVDALAAQAHVSMPTIMRTTRQFGFEGVREFKLALAQDLGRTSSVHRAVSLDDDCAVIVQKILGSTAASLAALQHQLNPNTLNEAADLLAQATRIDCYSVGTTSAFMADDLQGRLFRLGKAAHAIHDAHKQLISAASLGIHGVAVAISHVGRMPFLLESVSFARQQGAKVIAITQPHTPLADMADVVIDVMVPPDAVMRVGTEAYIAHLLVIELLMILVLQKLGPKAIELQSQYREVLHQHGQDVDQHPWIQWAWPHSENEAT